MSKSALIVCAGAAGLACAADLARAGVAVTILEGRDRIGGRIFTQHIPNLDLPIELGAEFIHGKASQIFGPMQQASQQIIESSGDDWCFEEESLCECNFFEKVEALLEKMKKFPSPDRSFTTFLRQLPREAGDESIRERALEYVSGFNAADPAKISVQSLLKDMKRQEELGGDHTYRLRKGYGALVEHLRKECAAAGAQIKLQHVVKHIDWSAGLVVISGRAKSADFEFEVEEVVITVPVSAMRTGVREASIKFSPALPESKLRALKGIELGPVIRVTLVFRERFWKQLKGKDGRSLSNMRFLFSHDQYFPTWWTTQPVESPLLVAWSPAARAEQFSGWSKDAVVAQPIASLSQILPVGKRELESLLDSYFMHDWQADPFARGAYSYLCVGAADACAELARPIGTLHFAGEATDINGDHATVHGAIESGRRAAREILEH